MTAHTEPARFRPDRARNLLAAATLIIPTVIIVVTWLLWRDRLPAELATHWSDFGTADEVTSASGTLAISLSLAGTAAVVGVVLALVPRISAVMRRFGFFLAGVFAGMGASTWLLSAGLTMQAGDPYDAVIGAWVLLLIGSALYGVIPVLIAPKVVQTASTTVERMPLEPGETAAWSGTITGAVFGWALLGVVLAGLASYLLPVLVGASGDASILGLVVVVLAALAVVSFIRVRMTADRRGLRLVNLFGMQLKRIPLDQIAAVEAVEVLEPAEWGGWGYRMLPGRSALILRRGPGLIVTTAAGKQFAVTLPDPQVPGALLAALIHQTTTPASSKGS